MSHKAQATALVFMLALVVVILAIAFAQPINETTTSAMSDNATDVYGLEAEAGHGLDCSNSSISDFQKAGCWVTDIGQAYFFWGVLAFAGVIIASKIIFE